LAPQESTGKKKEGSPEKDQEQKQFDNEYNKQYNLKKSASIESANKSNDSPKRREGTSPRLFKSSPARAMAKESTKRANKEIRKEDKAIKKAIKAGTLPP
jgi:hypothetical protein